MTVDTTNAVDAAIEAGALFKVHSEPLTVSGETPAIKEGKYKGDPIQKILHRIQPDGTIKVLNVVHPSFPESNYLQLFETAEALFPESTTAVKVIDDGEQVMLTQEIGSEIDLGGGDTIRPHLLWTGSLNSTWATGCHGLAHRFFCANQLPLSKAHISARRTLNHDSMFAYRSQILAQVMDRMAVFIEGVSTLKSIKISGVQFLKILSEIMPEPGEDAHTKTINTFERKLAAVRYYWSEESDGPAAGTAWAAFNAVQSAESHDFTEGKAQVKRQVEMVMKEQQPMAEAMKGRVLAGV